MRMKMKAQSAMEYLMTYGWAILIVIIVAAALYALGVFNPATYTGSQATGFPNLGAPREWQFDSASNQLTVILQNQKVGRQITVNNVSATCGSGGSAVESSETAAGTVTISAGGTSQFTFTCDNLNAGDPYSYEIVVKYVPSGLTLEQVDRGRITGTAQ